MAVGPGEERGVPDLDDDARRRALLGGDVGGDQPGEPGHLRGDPLPVIDVLLESCLPAAGAWLVGLSGQLRRGEAAGRLDQPWAGGRAEARGEYGRVRGGQVGNGPDAQPGQLSGRLGADAPEGIGWLAAHHLEPCPVREPEDSRWLAEAGGQLGLKPVLPDADRAVQLGGGAHALLDVAGHRLRIGAVGGHERLIPAHHLDDGFVFPQRGHDLSGDRLVGLAVDGQEHRVRAAPRGGPQRLPRVHAERAGLVGGRGHHAALRRIPVTADYHRAAAQFRMSQDLDGRDELVKVHVQYPAGHTPVLPGGEGPRTRSGGRAAPLAGPVPSRTGLMTAGCPTLAGWHEARPARLSC